MRKKVVTPTKKWPASSVSMRSINEVIPYSRNARVHSDTQIQQIAKSITEFGFTIPILVDEKGELIAGHGRVLAAQHLGLEAVPVMTASGWTKAQIKAYRIADNQLTMNSWKPRLTRNSTRLFPGARSKT